MAGGLNPNFEEPWRERTIEFNVSSKKKELGAGEYVIDHLEKIEDNKGNNGLTGTMIITNLRIIWYLQSKPSVNMTIGLRTVNKTMIKTTDSKILGETQAMHLYCTSRKSKFQFIFTPTEGDASKFFETVEQVIRAFQASNDYREMQVRTTIVKDGSIRVLPQEEVMFTEGGVWNLAGDKGELGKLHLSNVRIIWHSELDEAFNMSLPFCHIAGLSIQESRYGTALVIKTSKCTGSLNLGFRIDPAPRLKDVFAKVNHIYKAYIQDPIKGVEFDAAKLSKGNDVLGISSNEDVEIVKSSRDVLAAYMSDGHQGDQELEPVFSQELGLAIEPLRGGITLQQLWSID